MALENRIRSVFAVLRSFPGTIFAVLFFLFFLYGWSRSSRFSERHLFHFGNLTLEVFTANSLFRASFLESPNPAFGVKTSYRHPNPRGRFDFKPAVPRWRSFPGLFEITMGYWHLASSALIAVGVAGSVEIRRWFRCRGNQPVLD